MRGVDYYELLGVSRTATADEIRAAYRALAKAMHPDRGGTAGAFRLLREAYETLSDATRRADYDRGEESPDPPGHGAAGFRGGRAAGFGGRRDETFEAGDVPRRQRAERAFAPTLPVVDPDTVPWWDAVRGTRPAGGHARWTVLAAAGGVGAVVVPLALVGVPAWLVVVALMAGGAGVAVLAWRHLAARRRAREHDAEFGARVVFGRPGAEPDELGERLTAELLSRYLTRIPGVRICHGLAAEEGSVFADLDHAVLCGRRLVLIESKLWLPGHYEVADGEIRRNGHRFRGGESRLPEWLTVYRALLPDVEVRGALLIYPSRAGEVTTGGGVAHTPGRFVREVGAWLAAEPATVDPSALRTLLRQVTTG